MDIHLRGTRSYNKKYTDKCNEVIRNRHEYTFIISFFIWILLAYLTPDYTISQDGESIKMSMGVLSFIWCAYGIMGIMATKNVEFYDAKIDYLIGGPIRWFQCAITYYYIRKYNKSDIQLQKEERNRKINKIIRGF